MSSNIDPQTPIPPDFGSGGTGIQPGYGKPDLVTLLAEHEKALADLDTALQAAQAAVGASLPVQKKTATVLFSNAALAAALTNGLAATVNVDTALPASARVVGLDMRGLTPFTGGSASAVSVDLGTAGDPNALVAGADVFAAAVDGGPATMPLGVRPNKTFAAGGQLQAVFTPDGGHKLGQLTAGSVIIDVLYVVLP